jgi:hypothetical protein
MVEAMLDDLGWISVPGSPGPVHVEAVPGSATLTWALPAVTGGPAITGYQVTAVDSAGRAVVDLTIPESSLTITGLDGQQLRVQVRALNAVGVGEATTSFAASARELPNPPRLAPSVTRPAAPTVPSTTTTTAPTPLSPNTTIALPSANVCSATFPDGAANPNAVLARVPVAPKLAGARYSSGRLPWLLLAAGIAYAGEWVRLLARRAAK